MEKVLFNELLTKLTPDEQKYMASENEGIADIINYYYEEANGTDEKKVIEALKVDMISSLSDEIHDEMSFETTKELKEWVDYLNFMYKLIFKIENFIK